MNKLAIIYVYGLAVANEDLIDKFYNLLLVYFNTISN